MLVDRIWPRGIAKEKAKLDEWLKDIGPSNELRKWFNHEQEKYPTFKNNYEKELQKGKQKESFDQLYEIVKKHKVVTLLFAAKDEKYNQAVVLKQLLENIK